MCLCQGHEISRHDFGFPAGLSSRFSSTSPGGTSIRHVRSGTRFPFFPTGHFLPMNFIGLRHSGHAGVPCDFATKSHGTHQNLYRSLARIALPP